MILIDIYEKYKFEIFNGHNSNFKRCKMNNKDTKLDFKIFFRWYDNK